MSRALMANIPHGGFKLIYHTANAVTQQSRTRLLMAALTNDRRTTSINPPPHPTSPKVRGTSAPHSSGLQMGLFNIRVLGPYNKVSVTERENRNEML